MLCGIGGEPTPEELSDKLGIPPEKLGNALAELLRWAGTFWITSLPCSAIRLAALAAGKASAKRAAIDEKLAEIGLCSGGSGKPAAAEVVLQQIDTHEHAIGLYSLPRRSTKGSNRHRPIGNSLTPTVVE